MENFNKRLINVNKTEKSNRFSAIISSGESAEHGHPACRAEKPHAAPREHKQAQVLEKAAPQ